MIPASFSSPSSFASSACGGLIVAASIWKRRGFKPASLPWFAWWRNARRGDARGWLRAQRTVLPALPRPEIPGNSLPKETIPFARDSVVPKTALEPCPPRFMVSVTPATVNLGSSKNSGLEGCAGAFPNCRINGLTSS